MVALSFGAAVVFYFLNSVSVFAQEFNFEDGIQIHGDRNAMSLNLLRPVNTNLITKTTEGCSARLPTHFKPKDSNRLTTLYWLENRIFEVDQDSAQSISEVTVYRNCYDTLVDVKVGNTSHYLVGKNELFEGVDADRFAAELADMQNGFTVDIGRVEKSDCLILEQNDALTITWYSVYAASCYYVDKVVDNNYTLWSADGCNQRFAGATIVVDGEQKLVLLLVFVDNEPKQLFFRSVAGRYQEITLEEMQNYYEEIKAKDAAALEAPATETEAEEATNSETVEEAEDAHSEE
ncbi:uncharacterized protein BXIN_0070 [Babesia sp. Xinjiang]|uniref:uncharacterized protein n=1 Tax=Babesia sp. Xinjiang TaxID=462227 RepID=UPI000A22B00B|nr:uncharacterized protein BXIN_0070 [Babesia sp. Xinjiang]ORM39689.1 hypothetical protein BXIN_0070 [Babesia sp. Xinjiang]